MPRSMLTACVQKCTAFHLPESDDYAMDTKLTTPTMRARLRWHRLFDGIHVRIAKRLRVDPSYVFRVGHGERNSAKVMQALEIEMKRLDRLKPR